jgi:hypothetical protein
VICQGRAETTAATVAFPVRQPVIPDLTLEASNIWRPFPQSHLSSVLGFEGWIDRLKPAATTATAPGESPGFAAEPIETFPKGGPLS